MKKAMRRLTAFGCLLAMLAAAVPAVTAADKADRTIGRLDKAPYMDGVISAGEWGAADFSLHDYQMATVPGGAAKVELDGQVWLGWDATHFYLAITAIYDDHRNDEVDYTIYKGDAVQFQLSADGVSDRRSFCMAIGTDGTVRGYQSSNNKHIYLPEGPGGDLYVTRDEQTKTTVYEAAIPLSWFTNSLKSLTEGHNIGFSFAMHMHNGYYYEWYAGVAGTKDLTLAAQLALGGKKDQSAGGKRVFTGDTDGSGAVNASDATLALQYAAGKVSAAAVDLHAGDADGDGAVTSTDARLILQRYAKKISVFPAGDTQDVIYGVPDGRAVSSNSFSPTDLKAGYSFTAFSSLEKKTKPKSITDSTNQFGYFAFSTELNEGLPFNLNCYIKDGRITAMLPAGADLSALIPTFTYYGGEVRVNGMPLVSEVTVLDFTDDVVFTLIAKDGSVATVTAHLETLDTGLPSVAMTTADYTAITSKMDYEDVVIYLGGADAGDGVIYPAQAKGRGNSSWNREKKGYTVKLEKKAALLGMSESRDWCLIANYEDKTLLRNNIAEYLADAAGIYYVVHNRPVDLWYNGTYWGTYNLTEKIEVEKDRLNITKYEPGCGKGNTGFLFEFDGHVNEVSDAQKAQWQQPLGSSYPIYYDPVSGELFMHISISSKWLVIKKPSEEALLNDKEQLRYAWDTVQAAENALKTNNYTTISKYFDTRSFAKWYLVEEYMNNTDASFHSSCYVSLDVGGKFTMGPVWDFDRSSENCDYWNPEESLPSGIYNSAWAKYMVNCTEYRKLVKEEYAKFRPALLTINQKLEEMANEIYASQQYNFEVWDILERAVNASRDNNVSQAQKASQTFEAEIRRLERYFDRRTAAFDAFVATL